MRALIGFSDDAVSRAWLAAALALCGAVAGGIVVSDRFAAGTPKADMPVLPFAITATAVGLAFLFMLPLVRCSEVLPDVDQRRLLWLVVLTGATLRIALLASEPILEVDFNRYLWDGALTANGFNPYAVAPARISDLAYDDRRLELSRIAGDVFERISYPELKTVYPPVAQAAFALAYKISPFSLTAWRCIALLADAVTLALLIALLKETGRSSLWSALYWWCPLVLKEIANSAHMEAVLLPPLLAALLFSVRGRHIAAAAMLTLAMAIKLWPVMLAPLILRPLLRHPGRLVAALGILVAGGVATALPIWLGGIDTSSGFVGFATHWATNNAYFPHLERAVAAIIGSDPGSAMPGRIIRLISAGAVFGTALWLSRSPLTGPGDLIRRVYLVVSLLLLLSPAQFPWYVLWVLPLAVLDGRRGWYVAAATLWAYYAAFHFIIMGRQQLFENYVVWIEWLPIWVALAWEAWRCTRVSQARDARRFD